MAGVQLQQLAYFVAVAEIRHFTQAAESLGIAQPSLSKQIRTLEGELGAPLFSRARGNITLTPAGEILLPLAKRILADVDTARLEVRELAGLVRGRVRLGATPSLCAGLLADVLRRFHDVYPGISLTVEEGGSLLPPKHILNAPTRLMKQEGYGRGYAYDHNEEEAFSGQNYFPDGMERQTFYAPTSYGYEAEVKQRLDRWAKLRRERSKA